ncbi:MAG: hypothetical protein QHC67_02940 [Sphingobium sp.]|uniref:hypothetical protein n=1 Tax=Sphingobium sp. TaxID=1912891 RepID=UPI0029B9B32F|nr:hypothetical protein [Sphingobium sp.]MDX3908754.1 hypothetical protein [Sphingobium sp.]
MNVTKRIALPALAFTLLVSTTHGTAAPDFLAANTGFEQFARMVHSAGTCGRLGYQVDRDGLTGFAETLISDAVMDGIAAADADTILDGALQRERDNQSRLVEAAADTHGLSTTPAEAAATLSARAHKFADYWTTRCADLAKDGTGARFFRPVSSTATTNARNSFIADVEKKLRN